MGNINKQDMNNYSYLEKAKEHLENKDYDQALIFVLEYLKVDEKYYYEATLIKIKALIGKDNLDGAIKTLEEELSMPYIPSPFNKEFEELYEQVRKQMNANKKEYSPFDCLDNDELKDKLMNTSSNDNLLMLINQIDKRNIRLFMDELKKLLVSYSPNYIKSLILEIMCKQGINEEVKLIKDSLEMSVIPSSLPPIAPLDLIKKIDEKIDEYNINKNVSINEIANNYLILYLADIYPLTVEETEIDSLAKALYKYASELLNNDHNISLNKLENYYYVRIQELKGL